MTSAIKRTLLLPIILIIAAPFDRSAAADNLGDQGWALIRGGKVEEAARLFHEAAIRDPKNVLAHRGYQDAMTLLGRTKDLTEEYLNNRRQHPKDGLAVYLYTLTLSDDKRTSAEIAEALKDNPGDPWLLAVSRLYAAGDEINAGREEKALESLKEPTMPGLEYDARPLRAWALADLGRFDEAIQEYKQAAQDLPFSEDAYDGLSAYYSVVAEYRKALAAADQALLRRDSPTAHSYKAQALKMLGRVRESEAEFDKVRSLPPVLENDYDAVGWAFVRQGEIKKGWMLLDEYRKRSICICASANPLFIETQMFGPKQARQDCDALLKISPHNVDVLYVSAGLHQAEGCDGCGKAIEEYSAILKLNPRNVAARLGRVNSYLMLGKNEDAIKDAQTALKMAPDDWETLATKGGVESRLGKYADSIRSYERAVALNPESAGSWAMIGYDQLLLKRPQDSETSFAQARLHPGLMEKDAVESTIESLKKEAETKIISAARPVAPGSGSGNRFTEAAQRVILIAQEEAKLADADQVDPNHILIGVIALSDSDGYRILERLKASPSAMQSSLVPNAKGVRTSKNVGEIPFSIRARGVLEHAVERAQHEGSHEVTTAHLLLGVSDSPDKNSSAALAGQSLTPERLLQGVADFYASKPLAEK